MVMLGAIFLAIKEVRHFNNKYITKYIKNFSKFMNMLIMILAIHVEYL